MTQWEYKKVETFRDVQALGLQGWELVGVVQPLTQWSNLSQIIPERIEYTLKRKIEQL